MRNLLIVAALALAVPAFASDGPLTNDTMLGKTLDEVSASLKDMGYEVRKGEMEDGQIEVYFVKDKTMGEVYVDPASGKITKLTMK